MTAIKSESACGPTTRAGARTLPRAPDAGGEILSCSSCPCGQAAGIRYGGRCPLVERRRRPDEIVYLEGEPVTTVWFVKRGTVVLSRTSPDGGEQSHTVRGPGSFLGLEGLIRASYADTARTTEASSLCAIGKDDLDAWFGPRGTPVRMALERQVAVTCAAPPRAAAADGTSVQRVARWLLSAEQPGHVPRRVMASLLGMVPETLSRALARLDAEGAIVVTRRTVTVRDRTNLERLAA